MKYDVIKHPILGDIPCGSTEHYTDPIYINGFNRTSIIILNVDTWDDGVIDDRHINQAVKLINSDTNFVLSVEKCIFDKYSNYIYYDYLHIVGNPEYSFADHDNPLLTHEQLPKITKQSDIWKVIIGFSYIWVEDTGNFALVFKTTYDDTHDLHVKYEFDEISEVMMN